MMTSRLVVAVLLLAASFQSVVGNNNCMYEYGSGVSFNLGYLTIGGWYKVEDINAADKNFSYFFNVCGDTGGLPSTPSTPATTCAKNSDASPAWQLSNEFDLCVRLGDSPSDVEFAIEDEYDPTRGVSMTYKNGDQCTPPFGTQPVNRSLTLHFLCDDGANIFEDEPVDETEWCEYEIFLRSTFGCPIQCFGSNLAMCSSRGVCGYDTDAESARCFCYPGYEGDLCEQETQDGSSGLNGTDLALILASILLVLVMVVLGWLWYKIKTLRLDPAAYESLGDGPPSAAAPAALPMQSLAPAHPVTGAFRATTAASSVPAGGDGDDAAPAL